MARQHVTQAGAQHDCQRINAQTQKVRFRSRRQRNCHQGGNDGGPDPQPVRLHGPAFPRAAHAKRYDRKENQPIVKIKISPDRGSVVAQAQQMQEAQN